MGSAGGEGAACWPAHLLPPAASWCSCFQGKGEKCSSVRRVLEYNDKLGRSVTVKRKLSQLW